MSNEFKRIVEEDKPQEGGRRKWLAAPHRLRLLLVSLTWSVALAVGASVLAETLDTSFQDRA